MKIKDNVNLDVLFDLGFQKEKFIGYVLNGEKEGDWIKQIATVNEETRNIWISKGHEEEVKKLLKDYLEKNDEDN